MDRTPGLLVRLLKQLGPSLIAFVLLLPLFISTAVGDGSEEARYVFQFIRSPHHYVTTSFAVDFWALSGWLPAGFAGLFLLKGTPYWHQLVRL
ncbi:hypothetical protein RZS08_61325, partial [Arthrospira platensis SPKY1]|nr:hypothetical protein [Arthrospira platensis SPKY1]